METEEIIKELEEILQFEHNPKGKNPVRKNDYLQKEEQLKDLLIYFRTSFKYLIFANEAYERENSYLRQLLEKMEE